jgi:tRNA-specific adenosine deaminase 1
VEGETPDPRSAGADFHALGTLRRKPGRSDLPAHLQSTSMSCSDKLALWARCGLQGALLSRIMGPVLYESVVVTVPRAAQGAKKAAHDAIERALVGRFGRPRAVAGTAAPRVAVTSERFDYEKSGERIRASGFSLLWAEDDVSRVEVVAGALGLLQGATSKSAVSPRTWPSVCKMSLARRALALWDRHGIVAPAPPRVYRACKESARDYCDDKRSLQGAEGPMRNWSHAPAQVDDFVVGD